MEVIDPAELAMDETDHRELEFQQQLMETCYVKDTGPDREGKKTVGVDKRRKEAKQILAFFNLPWSGSKGFAHTCPAGCCGTLPAANRAKSLERANEFVKLIFLPPITEPAQNKYTKTDPCIRSVALVTWTFGLLRKAIGRKLFQNEEATGPADVVEADGAIGVPRDEYQYQQKLGHLKVQKIHTFLGHGSAKHLLLVWVVVCGPIMKFHYFLFANGKFFSQRTGEHSITVFDFVGNGPNNHLAAAMGALSSMLMDATGRTGGRHLRMLYIKLGPIRQWPDRTKAALQVALLIGISVIWRK